MECEEHECVEHERMFVNSMAEAEWANIEDRVGSDTASQPPTGRNSTTGQTWDLIWYQAHYGIVSSLSRLNGHDFLSETLALPSRRTLLTTT